jgi:hypothetical protein
MFSEDEREIKYDRKYLLLYLSCEGITENLKIEDLTPTGNPANAEYPLTTGYSLTTGK